MSFSDLLNMVQSYAGVDPKAPPESTTQDFHNVTQAASHDQVAGGLSEVFRSNQTPPFGEMLSGLFGNSDGQQRAGILGQLIQSAGPGLAGSVLGQYLPGLAHGNTQITPEQAQQVPPEAVQDLAKHAEKNDPSIVDQASQFYAQHPQVVQALGAGALAMILNHMSKRR
jgi:hypothetical protein